MALIKVKEIKTMSLNDRGAKLRELQDEIMHERGTAAMGGAPANPGRIRAIRTNIARILTVQQEEEK